MRLSHAWGSDHMFRAPDGTRNEELRVRSRLWMSVVYDTIWWSQDGDGCLHRAGCPHDNFAGNNDIARDPSAPRQSTVAPTSLPFAYNSVFDGELPFDLGWALSDDVFFASAGWNV